MWHQSVGEDRDLLKFAIVLDATMVAPEPGIVGETLSLTLQLKNGQKIRFEVWRDDEGNGPGAFVPVEDLGPSVETRKRKR